MSKFLRNNFQTHPFHLAKPSPLFTISATFSTSSCLNADSYNSDSENSNSVKSDQSEELTNFFRAMHDGTQEQRNECMAKHSNSSFEPLDPDNWDWLKGSKILKQDPDLDKDKIFQNTKSTYEAHHTSMLQEIEDSDESSESKSQQIKAENDLHTKSLQSLERARENISASLANSDASSYSSEDQGNSENGNSSGNNSPMDYVIQQIDSEPMDINDPDG